MLSKNKKRLGIFGALAIVGSLGAAGIAAAEPKADGDKQECKGRHGDHGDQAAKFDANGDGKLDDSERATMRAEHEARRETRLTEMFAKLDADKNGAISANEAKTFEPIAKRFAEVDTNKDGALSKDELRAAAPKHGERHHGPGGPDGRGPKDGPKDGAKKPGARG